MKKLSIVCMLFLLGSQSFAQSKMTDPATEAKITALLSKMTIQEKVGQMTQITLDVVGKGENRYTSFEPFALDDAKVKHALLQYHIGSILNTANNRARTPEVWYNIVSNIQKVSTKEMRMKIPNIYGIDAIHGATYTVGATMFPQQIAQAASFNRPLVRLGAEITAYETRASNIPWIFTPLLDLGSDPRSPRQWESFGEDPYVIKEMGVQQIKGMEGDKNTISDPARVASCMKHFLGYQVPVSGKDRTPAFISDQALREYHLPPFKAGVDAGAHTIMINSSSINYIPVHSSYHLLTELLKQELGFEGIVITDWGDIENLYTRDHIAADHKEAIRIAINAGIDMSMVAYNYEVFCDNLVALVNEGKVTQARIDDAVRRILRVKYKLGLFDKPNTNFKDYPKFGSKEFELAAYQTAAEAITLLKNTNNVLPLAKTTKVLITGPNANSMRTINGAWTYSWQGEKTEEFAGKYNTFFEAIQNKAGKENVTYIPGVSYKMDGKYFEEFEDKIEEAVAAAAKVDVVILCVGENSYTETPGNLSDLYLSDLQTALANRLIATGKPVVLILNEGRPRIISKFEHKTAATVQTYLPGNFGGDALADILYGDVNPSGKLPYTYPRFPNALTTYYHKPSEERDQVVEGIYNYDADYNPQYVFGSGLSYTTYKYSNLKVSSSVLKPSETLTISVDVTNTGKREGKETVLLYISDLVASITPDMKRLRGFEKITLKSGETKTVTFTISPEDIGFINASLKKVTEPGEFRIQLGDQKLVFNYAQ